MGRGHVPNSSRYKELCPFLFIKMIQGLELREPILLSKSELWEEGMS